ncbi:TIGR03667 family PPOX class F420-dependent oxidoreductase [Pseudonocardia sp. GCM10023141]|uniref:TIGR03667 family PPOX class F420-dependent oxidoreductase n=1 Tax=Pseudonocardia sp. GCM10023141 TaxID=3252653 RepID=UPI00362072F0
MRPGVAMAMPFALPDPTTEFGARVTRRLDESVVAWLTIVDAAGTPQPAPVWFVWDGETALVHSHGEARRRTHLRANPKVALHLDSDEGGDVIVLTGNAEVDATAPPMHGNPAYVAKYGERIAAESWQTPENFAAIYSVPVRFRPQRVRGH